MTECNFVQINLSKKKLTSLKIPEEKIIEKQNQVEQNINLNKQTVISEKTFSNSTGASPNTLKFARELGALIGLSIGYIIKYQLDKKYVFEK